MIPPQKKGKATNLETIPKSNKGDKIVHNLNRKQITTKITMKLQTTCLPYLHHQYREFHTVSCSKPADPQQNVETTIQIGLQIIQKSGTIAIKLRMYVSTMMGRSAKKRAPRKHEKKGGIFGCNYANVPSCQ